MFDGVCLCQTHRNCLRSSRVLVPVKPKLIEFKKKNTILKIVMKGKQKVSHFDLGDLLDRLF